MRNRAAHILVLVACAWGIAFGAAAAHAQEKAMTPLSAGVPSAEGIRMLEVGDAAPDFSIRDPEGFPFHFAEEKGKRPILLVFWSIFCEPCRFEMPIIQKVHNRHKDSGLDVVAVALDGEPLKGSVLGFVRQEGYTFKVLIDELDSKEMFKAADPYGVAGTPTIYLIDRAGRIALAKAGRMREEELEKAVQAVLKK
ncbi:MAG TPA: TlpA disulfide reductase family protein [Candidatus Deferrimicrobiaceae bacterium]|nr:TlpA disulfide reductase family protein [Candidatus Deferrimicrobiaceae bacterium]